MRIERRTTLAMVVLVATMIGPARAEDTIFTYQGRLDEAGAPASGVFDLDFALWDADAGGNQIGATVQLFDVLITEGLFTVELDFGPTAFNDDRWLEIAVDSVTLSPRQPVTAAPTALHLHGVTRNADGYFGIGTTSPGAKLEVRENDTEAILGVSIFQNGVVGAAASDSKAGVYGTTSAISGNGVFGRAVAVNASSNGVLGRTVAATGAGVRGEATNLTGVNYGVYGSVASDSGIAVSGLCVDGAAGTAVQGVCDDPAGWAGRFLGRTFLRDHTVVGVDGVRISSQELFGIHSNTSNGFAGMYVSTAGDAGHPFYGYSAGRDIDAYTYFDGADDQWRLYCGSERIAVDRVGGNVGIGTVAPNYLLHVNGSAGKPGGGSWSNSSDRRLKQDITDLDGALDRLLQLRGVTYAYIDPAAIGERPGRQIGVIAQEVEPVFPDWVDTGAHGFKTVTFRGFEALAVEALRELDRRGATDVAALRAEKDTEIASLRRENAALTARLERLERLVADRVAVHGTGE